MKNALIILLLSGMVLSASAISDTTAVAGATVVQSAVNSGMLIYWQSQGVQSSLVSTPTGTYVVPVNNAGTGNQSPTQNQYQTQNDQQSKQAFFNN